LAAVSRFPVLIHAPLYAALRRLPAQVRSRFRHRVERLGAGEWGGGTRVKKLRGCAKPVFEARQDAGDRILFTLAHTAARDAAGTLPPHLQVWDLVTHDRVSRRAARINPSAEAEFLDFEEVESEPIDRPPAHPAASFADVPPETGPEAGLLEFVAATDGLRPRVREEVVGGVRWYVLPDRLVVDEARWQELMDRGGDELELKLTGEQYRVVRTPGPVLLSGSAGSGKTTIAVHRLAAAACGPGRPCTLYVTYSRWLLDHARRLFLDLLACRGDDPEVPPAFLTIHDLYRTIVAGAGGAAPDRIVEYPEFVRWYRDAFRREDAALAWEEIRSIVKGASLDPARPLLARDEYEALGRKRAPLFAGERPRLHLVARRWQERLEAAGLVDEIDLCRLALARVPAAGLYDHVLCDEAQDLAEIQVELLLRLHRGPAFAGLVLAGDPQQVINPSGFRWAEVRSRIRDRFLDRGRAVPELHVLTRNFRSVRGLVELANEVLAFKRDRIGRSDGDQPEESVVAGAVPILVAGDEADLVEAVRGFGPRCAVVAGSAEVRERLQVSLDTTRVFTVPEAKGLEFDAAILWGVLAGDPGPWHRLLDPALDLREDPGGRRALHHLYVAVTRARRHLAVYEPAGAPPLWASERFAGRLDPESPASLARLFVRSAPPEDWVREGEYFRERGRHRQAAECFRRAGDLRREAESLALHHEAAGEFAAAAQRWLVLENTARAAQCLERALDYAAAAHEWARAGQLDRAARCRARAAEASGRWSDAAGAWEELGAWDEAARCWANLGIKARQTRCLARAAEQGGRHALAAQRWAEVDEWERAAAAWCAAGREGDARQAEARGHEVAGRWEHAARAWDAAGDASRALRCRAEAAEGSGRWEAAARAWEQASDFAAAMRAWQRAGKLEEGRRCAARRDLVDGRFVRAAEALEDLGDFAAAADTWAKAAAARQQPSTPRPLPLPRSATRAWCEGGKPARLARTQAAAPGRLASRRQARGRARPARLSEAEVRGLACSARAAEDAGRFDDAASAWRALGDHEQVLRCRVTHLERAGEAAPAAQLLMSKHRYQAAADRWRRAGDAGAAARCEALQHERHGRLEDAIALWASLGERDQEARCRGHLHLHRGEYDEAARHYERAGAAGAQLAATARRLASAVRRVPAPREGARGAARRPAPSTADQGALFPPPAREPAAAPAETILNVVRRHPGLTCEGVAAVARLTTEQVRPILAALTAGGRLVKTGRTRGTRYSPA
jgi:tetratricopeptide (TPR) repeat protein